MNEGTACGTETLEQKLRGILKRIRCEGFDLSRGMELAADKLSGSIPKPESPNCKAPWSPDSVIGVTSDIEAELAALFASMRDSLNRAHNAIGDFSQADVRDESACNLAPAQTTYPTEPYAAVAKPRRY